MPDILIDPRAAAELTRLRVVRAAYLPEVPMVVVVVPVRASGRARAHAARRRRRA